MSWVTVIWSLAAGVSLTLAAVHVLVWLRDRSAIANLLFAVSAVAAAVIAGQELTVMRAQAPAEFAGILRWMHVSAATIVVAVVWFIRCYLGAGRLWLAWAITGLRGLILIVNFLFPNATFVEIQALREVSWLGESLSAPIGEMNPWRYAIHLSTLLLVVYVVDAAITAQKRGRGRQAWSLAAVILLAIALSAVFSGLMVRGVLPGPLIALVYLVIVVVMAVELSADLLRARQIARELQDSRERMRLAAQAADLGLWEWDVARDVIWTNEVIDARAGIRGAEPVGLNGYLALVHPDDRERMEAAIHRTLADGSELQEEYRMTGPDGNARWFDARGRVEYDDRRQPLRLLGVSADITARKELEAQALRHRGRASGARQLPPHARGPVVVSLRGAQGGQPALERRTGMAGGTTGRRP